MAREFRRQAGAGIVGQTRRAVADVRQRRQQIRGGVRVFEMPEPLGIPRPHLRQPLPADAPAEVRAFHDVMPARLVAAVAVVVGGEEIAKFVEGQLLRIAQTARDDFQFRAVGIAAKDTAAVGEQFRRETGPGILILANRLVSVPRSAMLQ